MMDMGPNGDALEEGVVDGAPQPNKRKDGMGKDVNSVKCVGLCVMCLLCCHEYLLCSAACIHCLSTCVYTASPHAKHNQHGYPPRCPYRRFLNRILGLPVANQNLLYNYFFATLHSEVRAAKAEGRFVDGVTELPGVNASMAACVDMVHLSKHTTSGVFKVFVCVAVCAHHLWV